MMKRHLIGFHAGRHESLNDQAPVQEQREIKEPRKSVVQVYFPSRGLNLAYYNDCFDLKVGDLVYVDGKLEGSIGQVTEVSYSFKIKLSDYKRVIAVVDTNVAGDFYLAGSHLVSFDRNVIPFEKVVTWFHAPEGDEEYVSSNDDSSGMPLEDLIKMNFSHEIAHRGHDYYMENRVCYLSVDETRGHAIVQGSENYELEFDYINGEIRNLNCSCFCSYPCKHEFAAMLQLRETLGLIAENYDCEYGDYFAAISKNVFMNTVMNKMEFGKISLGESCPKK